MARLRVRVSGLVQGVFYRASTAQEASRLALVGWVRNEPDGTVLVEAQGERAAVEKLASWCRHGPRGARVTRVDQEWIDDDPGETTFSVRR
jgi:acylphosphatase